MFLQGRVPLKIPPAHTHPPDSPSPSPSFFLQEPLPHALFGFDPFDLQIKGRRNWGYLHEHEILQDLWWYLVARFSLGLTAVTLPNCST